MAKGTFIPHSSMRPLTWWPFAIWFWAAQNPVPVSLGLERLIPITARCWSGNNPRLFLSFLDHMVHPHSVLKYLAGEIESIFIRRNQQISSALVSLRFKSGAIGSLHFSHGQSYRSNLE